MSLVPDLPKRAEIKEGRYHSRRQSAATSMQCLFSRIRPHTVPRSEMNNRMAIRFEHLSARLEEMNRFASVKIVDHALHCQARDVESPALYILEPTDQGFAVMFSTPDRWLNESIEADLVHHGDDIAELIEEEFLEADDSIEGTDRPVVKHYRSDDLLYTFRTEFVTPTGNDDDLETACKWLLAYEAAFRELGDMCGPEED